MRKCASNYIGHLQSIRDIPSKLTTAVSKTILLGIPYYDHLNITDIILNDVVPDT